MVVLEGAGREIFMCDPAHILDGSELDAPEEDEVMTAGGEGKDLGEGDEQDDATFEMWTDELEQGVHVSMDAAPIEFNDDAVLQACSSYLWTRDFDSALQALGQEQETISRLLRSINSTTMAASTRVQDRIVALTLLAKLLSQKAGDPDTTALHTQFLRDFCFSLPALPPGIATELVEGTLAL
jgi:hypothetical protein